MIEVFFGKCSSSEKRQSMNYCRLSTLTENIQPKKKCWSASHSFMAHLKCWCGVHCGLGTKIQIDFFYNILLEWWYLCQPRYGLAFFDLNVGRDLKWKKNRMRSIKCVNQINRQGNNEIKKNQLPNMFKIRKQLNLLMKPTRSKCPLIEFNLSISKCR